MTTAGLPDHIIVLAAGGGRHYSWRDAERLLATGRRLATATRSPSGGWIPASLVRRAFAPGERGAVLVDRGNHPFLVADQHVDATTGTFLRIPAGVTHDFENRTRSRAGVLNVFIPGGFEANMPAIVEWFRTRGQAASRASST